MLSDGTRTYTWRNGRELATVTKGGVTWTNTYNADGLRLKRTNGTNTYSYIYNGGSLSQMTVDGTVMNFAYDASGTPMAVTYGGATYYYATNLQGDVVAILNASGTAVVTYTYDAWGNILTTTGTLASTLGTHNPLRYRGYVYDHETGLYYLQSRYYNPEMGRFICADSLVSTGQGVLGNNMFAYCLNNPVNLVDSSGTISEPAKKKNTYAIQMDPGCLHSFDVLVISLWEWMPSSEVMGEDMAAALGSSSWRVVPVTDVNFSEVWNYASEKTVIIHTHGAPWGLGNPPLSVSPNDIMNLQQNTSIENLLITACSVGGNNNGRANAGQMFSQKISPSGTTICSTTKVYGGTTLFEATNNGRWVVYRNGVQKFAILPTTLALDTAARYFQGRQVGGGGYR